jgi:hypothetical protein
MGLFPIFFATSYFLLLLIVLSSGAKSKKKERPGERSVECENEIEAKKMLSD